MMTKGQRLLEYVTHVAFLCRLVLRTLAFGCFWFLNKKFNKGAL